MNSARWLCIHRKTGEYLHRKSLPRDLVWTKEYRQAMVFLSPIHAYQIIQWSMSLEEVRVPLVQNHTGGVNE